MPKLIQNLYNLIPKLKMNAQSSKNLPTAAPIRSQARYASNGAFSKREHQPRIPITNIQSTAPNSIPCSRLRIKSKHNHEPVIMFRLISRAQAYRLARHPHLHSQLRHSSSKVSDPLRILFCGSDAFSCESLRALHREHAENKGLIEALDVMVLPGRRTGRGFKTIREGECWHHFHEMRTPGLSSQFYIF